MKFALVNPAWDFHGSIYFGCQAPHYPLELLFAFDKIKKGEPVPNPDKMLKVQVAADPPR